MSLWAQGLLLAALLSSYKPGADTYSNYYLSSVDQLKTQLDSLYNEAAHTDLKHPEHLITLIGAARRKLKAGDFWFRYVEPNAYKKLNGPLPVEWETEVFEKYESPYKREGAGLTLAYQYLQTAFPAHDSLLALINGARGAIKVYTADSIITPLNNYQHFFLCNRLFLLNLATIYTTGFDCPDKAQIIPELEDLLQSVEKIYSNYNADFPGHSLQNEYLQFYQRTIAFVQSQPKNFDAFDHFRFIRDYVNPLYRLNRQHILKYKVASSSWMDYTLNDAAPSIFDKSLFWAQNSQGIYSRIKDSSMLAEIDNIGKLLFYDPLLSGNQQRSCASCHNPKSYFTDTILTSAFRFNHTGNLTRNTPSLVNVVYNHLLHLDGKFLTLQDQAKGVMTNDQEMGGNEKSILENILSCAVYKKALQKFALQTPEHQVSFKHIVSALTFYYGKFSHYQSAFDAAINNGRTLDETATKGFNVFMGKAQCGTCHFAPLFNGIKSPYLNNEFEVVGTPDSSVFKNLSPDSGRFLIHPAPETKNAFRTPTLRNASKTKPYMHNGVFKTLEEVIDFYDAGGGTGKGMQVPNQTLSPDSLHLSDTEKKQLIAFINALDENINAEPAPQQLPLSKNKALNRRKAGGEY